MATMRRLFCDWLDCRSVPSYEVRDGTGDLAGRYCSEHGLRVLGALEVSEPPERPEPERAPVDPRREGVR